MLILKLKFGLVCIPSIFSNPTSSTNYLNAGALILGGGREGRGCNKIFTHHQVGYEWLKMEVWGFIKS